MWYHYFQFIVRLLIPLFLFMLVVTWKYLFFESSLSTIGQITERNLNTDFECPIHTNQMDVLENMYKCEVNSTLVLGDEQRYFLNGMIDTIPKNLPQARIQANMLNYTLLTR